MINQTQKLKIKGPAGQLEAQLHLPADPIKGIAVVAHPLPTMGGTMDNKVVTTLCKAFNQCHIAALRFNFRGTGNSEGSYDEGHGETEDTIHVTQWLQRRYPDLPLYCAGFSFGGYVQARAAETLQPGQLILIAPAVSRFAMPPVNSEYLIIHGDADDVITLDSLLQWARPQQLAITVLTGSGHFFHGRLAQLKHCIVSHLNSIA